MQKNLLIVFLILTIVGLSWLAFSYSSTTTRSAATEPQTTTSTQASKYTNIDVKTIERRANDNRSLLNVAYPVTENARINQTLKALSEDFIAEFTKTAAEQEMTYKKYLAETGRESNTIVTDYTQHFDVSFANQDYVSFVFDQYQTTGGTGLNTTFAKIFDRQTGVEIPLRDLFTDSSYLKRLSELTRDILFARVKETVQTLEGSDQALAEYEERNIQTITAGTEPEAENFDGVVITDAGVLMIYFDKYQVGAGSDGIVTVEIPLEKVSDLLIPEIKDLFSLSAPEAKPTPDPDPIVTDNKPKQPAPTTPVTANSSSDVDCAVLKCVALTFDDGPSVYTDTLLDTLKSFDVPATFFVLGRSAKIQPDTIARIVDEGHELGNHTWDHKDLRSLSDAEIDAQLQKTDELLYSLVGQESRYLRPPYGAYNDTVLTHIDKPIILWSVDPKDWKEPPLPELITRMTAPQAGAIILAHDIHQPTVTAIPEVITQLRAQGFTLVTVGDLLKQPIENGVVYRHR